MTIWKGNERPRAVIIGAGGQDGHYLTKHLASLGYRIVGVERDQLKIGSTSKPFSIFDTAAMANLISAERPHEVYYLAAHHHSSEEDAEAFSRLFDQSYKVHCAGLINVLDAIAKFNPTTRLFNAASCLIFGQPKSAPQNEETPFAPTCAYGLTKAMGAGICRLYRQDRGIFCASGILYNHESPRRSKKFVTRKITRAAVEISCGMQSKLELANLDVRVDWSSVDDVVRAMHAMLQIESPQDFIIASSQLHAVRDFVDHAFSMLDMDYRQYVIEMPSLLRREARHVPLVGDTAQIKIVTGWKPLVSFHDLVSTMIAAELSTAEADK